MGGALRPAHGRCRLHKSLLTSATRKCEQRSLVQLMTPVPLSSERRPWAQRVPWATRGGGPPNCLAEIPTLSRVLPASRPSCTQFPLLLPCWVARLAPARGLPSAFPHLPRHHRPPLQLSLASALCGQPPAWKGVPQFGQSRDRVLFPPTVSSDRDSVTRGAPFLPIRDSQASMGVRVLQVGGLPPRGTSFRPQGGLAPTLFPFPLL